jgi:uncharacterized protein
MSQTPEQRLSSDLTLALKKGDKERLATLRLLLTEIQNERSRKGSEVDEAAFIVLVRRAIKQRDEAAEQFDKGDRAELAAKERREKEILLTFLPPAASEQEIEQAAAEILAGLDRGPQAMGPLMKELRARFSAADGALLSRIARATIESR